VQFQHAKAARSTETGEESPAFGADQPAVVPGRPHGEARVVRPDKVADPPRRDRFLRPFLARGDCGRPPLRNRLLIQRPEFGEEPGREKKVESGKETAAERALVFLVSSRLSPLYCSIFGRDAAKNHRSRFSSPLINPDNILAISSRLSLSEMCSSGVSNRLR
jgi:hypothetical protein